MEWLQTFIGQQHGSCTYGGFFGIATAISPCPLATSITAIGFIGRTLKPAVGYSSMAYYNARSCNYYTFAGYRIDTNTQEGSSLFRYSVVYRQIRRTRTRPALLLIGFIHVSEAN